MPEWKPPAQFDFTSDPAPEGPSPSWTPPEKFDFTAPPDFEYRDSLYGDVGALKSASNYLQDTYYALRSGVPHIAKSAGWLSQNVGEHIPVIRDYVNLVEGAVSKIEGRQARPVAQVFDESGQKLRDAADSESSYWLDKISDDYEAAMQAGIYDEDFGVTTIVAGAAAALPESLVTMGAGAVAGKVTALAAKVGMSNIAARAAAGSVRAQRIMKWGSRAPLAAGAAVGGMTEGALAAGASGAAMEEQIMAMSHGDLLEGSARYFDVWSAAEGMPAQERESYAKTTVAEEAAQSVAARVGLSTGILSAPTGALFGHLGARAVKGTAAGKLATRMDSSVAGQAAAGFAAEGAQEFLQEGSQQFLQNLGLREYADKNQSLKEGVFSSMVIGGLIGGVMGGAIAPALGGGARKNAKADLAAGTSPAAADKPKSTAIDPTPPASRNPILEARITDLLTKVHEAQVPAVEFMQIARWAGHNQEGVGGGRSSLEFAKALEHLIETGTAPEDVSAAVGDDFTEYGMLTEAAYKKDAERFAFEVELRIKPTKDQVLPVLEAMGRDGINPYLMDDGTLVVPQPASEEAGLAAVGKAIGSKTGATIQITNRKTDNEIDEDPEVQETIRPSLTEGAAAESATAGTEGVLTPKPGSRTERVTQAVSGAPVSVQRDATVVFEPGMAQGDAQAAIDAAGGVLAATSPENDYREPTDAQKAAGNYPKLPLLFKGNAPGESVRVVVENVPGSKRKSMAGQPKWTRVMRHHYGYIPGTRAADGDPVDIYLGRSAHDADRPVFVIRQLDPKTGVFDEPKVIMGYEGEGEAKAAYLSEYPRSMHDKLFGGITRMDRAQFNSWVKSGATDVAPDPITKQPMLSLRRANEARSAEGGTPGNETGAREANARRAGQSAAGVEGRSGTERGDENPAEKWANWQVVEDGLSELSARMVVAQRTAGGTWDGYEFQITPSQSRSGSFQVEARVAPAAPAKDKKRSKKKLPKGFDNWFRGSKVVNEDGSPKVVYHGADVEPGAGMFDVFSTDDGDGDWGAFFATEREHAEAFVGGDGEVVEAYLSIKNPMIVTEEMLDEMYDEMPDDHPDKDFMIPRMFINRFIEQARAAGHDGIIATGFPDLDFDDTVYIAFNPEQIKSATDNSGAFDPANPSFLASLAPKVTRTPAFKRWFGDSKAVDENGDPLVVYHGTRADFDTFDVEKLGTGTDGGWFGKGIYLTPQPEQASRYAMLNVREDDALKREVKERAQGSVMPLYVRAENPFETDRQSFSQSYIDELRADGHDAIFRYDLMSDAVPKEIVVFDSRQLKSATGNSGAFDPANPSIIASLAPKAPTFHQGKIKPNAVSAMAVHYSASDGLKKLDPAKAGTGSAGGERRRMGMGNYGKGAKPGDIARRLYFYEQAGKDLPQKENAVAGHIAYRVRLENLYDLAADPDGLSEIIAETYGPMQMMNIDLIEETINELGYDGFIAEPEPGMHVRPIVLFGLKKQVPVERVTMPALSLSTSSSLLRHLTPAEQRKVTSKVAEKITTILEQLPPADEYAAAAYAGRAKRGWYRKSSEALRAVFGHEAPRFAALLAATSPQTSIESNLRNALNIWVNWNSAGRPTDRESILDVMAKSVEGKGGESSVLWAWVPNTERALTAEDPIEVMLSGPKVDSFMRNLLGDVQALTLDTWMANFAAFDKLILRGSLTKNDPGKRPTYLAMSARVREAAELLSDLTKETWTPAEVQETVWSWAKTLTELADSSGEIRTSAELVADKALTDELIQSTPDFGNLLADPAFGGILEERGYAEQVQQIRDRRAAEVEPDEEQDAGAEAAPFDPVTQLELEQRSARRLVGPRRVGRKDEVEDFSDVPFSLARKASIDSFTDDLRHQLKQPGYAVITATREGLGSHEHPTNVAQNSALREELDARGIEWLTASGVYKGEDQGTNFIIFTDEATAKELGAKYGQESVLTNRGLVYTDGTGKIVPATHANDVIGREAQKEDFHSLITPKHGGVPVSFSVGLDFDNIKTDTKPIKVNSSENVPDVFVAPGLYSAMYHAIQHEKGVPKQATAKQWSEWLDGAQRRGLFRAEERTWTEIDAMLQKRAERAEKDSATRVFRHPELTTTINFNFDEVSKHLLSQFPDGEIVTIDSSKIAIDDVLSTIEESYPEVEETVLEAPPEDKRLEVIDRLVAEEMEDYDVEIYSDVDQEDSIFLVKIKDPVGTVRRVEEFDSQEDADEWVSDNDPDGATGYFVEELEQWSAKVTDSGDWTLWSADENFASEDEAQVAADEARYELEGDARDEQEDHVRAYNITEARINEALGSDGGAQPEYEEWTAPGGENYREILFNFADGGSYSSPHFSKSDLDAGLLMHARVKDRYVSGANYSSTQKVLFIEEMQSDLHQEARESGGMMTKSEAEAVTQRLDKVDSELTRAEDSLAYHIPQDEERMPITGTRAVVAMFHTAGFDPSVLVDTLRHGAKIETGLHEKPTDMLASAIEANPEAFVKHAKAVFDLREEKNRLEKKLNSEMDPAPFHKSWPEVMLKHLVQYAAQNGYDAVAWTSGRQQAERYRGGLSQALDRLLWVPQHAAVSAANEARSIENGHTADDAEVAVLFGYQGGDQRIRYGFNRNLVSVDLINGERRALKDIVGGDIAAQVAAAPEENAKFDTDLVIGGKGMVVQYDQVMPKAMEKLVKKLGGSVHRGAEAGLARHTPGGTGAWRVDISPQMREALSQPLPAYSLAQENDTAAGQLAEAQAIVDEVASKLRGAPPYTVVGNDAGLPGHSRRQITALGADGRVEGFLDPVSGRVFIVAENVQLREGETYRDAVERVFAEETLGHYGLRAVFGKPALDKLFDQVYRDFKSDPRMRAIVDEYVEAYGDPTSSKDSARRMADEFLAKSNPDDQPSLWSMLVSWVRENLRKMGFVREWNDNDLRNLMERVFDSVRTGTVPSGLQKLSTALVEHEGTDVARTTVRDGRGARHTTERDGMRSVSTVKFDASILDGSIDSVPAAEISSFAGSLPALARFVGAEGKQRIVASLGIINEKAAQASGFPYRVEDGVVVMDIPKVVEKPSGIFSLRNRARGSDDVEAILEKAVAQPTSDMSFGQRMQKWFHEMTGYFGNADTWLELKTGWIDSATAIEKLERDQFNGSLLDASESAYKMINLTRNLPQIVGAVSKQGVPVYRDGSFVRQDGRKGLFEIFAPLWKTDDGLSLQYLWEGYAVARRSSQLINERNPDGTSKEKLLSSDEIEKLLELEQQHPEFKKVFDEWQQFNRELLDLAVDRGTMTAETAALWKQNDYVPFFRVNEEEDVVAGIRRTRGISGQKVTSKRLTGSDRRIQPVLENVVMNTASILEKVYRNEAMNRTVALADGVAMTRAPAHMEAVELNNADIARQLVKAGLFVGDDSNETPEQRRAGRLLREQDISYAIHAVERMSDEQRQAWTTFFRPARPEGNDIVSVMVAGKPVYYRVFDPLVLRGILDMTPTNFGGLMDVLGGAKRLLTTMVTLDPGFMMANYMRDTLSAWTTVNEDFTPMAGAIGDAVSIWTDGDVVEKVAMAGGMVGGFYNPTQDFSDVMRSITKSGGVVVNSVRSSVDAYRKIGMVSEQVNRVAIARAVLRRGGSISEAAYQAQDVMNFSQHGDAVAAQLLIRTVPFLNARIQGLYRLWKGMKGMDGADPKRARLAFMMKFAAIAGASMLLALRNADDERYEKLTDDQKDIYWHIFIGDNHFAIPKPFEVGVLSATIPERVVRRIRGQDDTRTTMHSMERALFETFAFNPIPQAFKPLVEQWANRTFFGQRPIVGMDIDNLEPVAQYNPWTSETARGVATVVDQVVPDPMKRYVPGTLRSPARIEHAVRAYFGTVGSYMLQLSDSALRQGGAFPDAPAMRDIRDVPALGSVVGRFYRGDSELEGRSKYQDDLYEALREADAAYSTVNAYINRGELEKAEELVEAKLDPLTVRPVLHAFKEEASELNTLQRQVMSSNDMTPEEKRELLDEIARNKTRLMREASPYLGLMDW